MILIIGAKAQGKLTFAKNSFNLSDNDITDKLETGKKAIYNLQKIVYDLLAVEKDAFKIVTEFANENDVIFICDEVGSGVVPIEKTDRFYRDEVGKICCHLAKKSEKVFRVFCGIGSVIKN